jgi:hypothetical protein
MSPEAAFQSDQLHISREPDGYPILPTLDAETPRSFKDIQDLFSLFMEALWGKPSIIIL